MSSSQFPGTRPGRQARARARRTTDGRHEHGEDHRHPAHGAAFYPLHRSGEDVPASPSFPTLEQEVLAYWKEDATFQASVDNRAGSRVDSSGEPCEEFVFYDGPPFANGLPHYGHLLTGYVKDAVGRYQTQRGRRVERRFGWDTHGLPAELEAQRELGIDDVTEITRPGGLGIEEFNAACRTSVLRYTSQWEDYVTRQARWVDFDNDYKTLDPTYMESVIWAFKSLYDKGLAYQGHRVLPYCWHDRTPLSNHELRMDDDVYSDRQDTTVTVGLRLEQRLDTTHPDAAPELALIWTTTPWTLPSNSAVAVGPDIEYVTVRVDASLDSPVAGQDVLLARDLLGAYARELGEDPQVLATYRGADLVGTRYVPAYDYFDDETHRAEGAAPGPAAWQVVAADYVTTTDGTGLVHLAPAFGEDDMYTCQAHGIGTVIPVDDGGCFTTEVGDYAGTHIFDANRPIVADLRDAAGPLARRPQDQRAVLVRQSSYVHSYPHCWRCRKPLIYKAVSSWFVRVTAIRDRMVELNQEIDWFPAHVKDGIFGNWLAGARDWSISRNRFWGAPIPVWVSDDPHYPRTDVYGSFAELERDFGVEVTDLHRPFIDTLTRPNPDDPTGRSTMRRIPDVLDCWFESGAMPFAQVHYPFENVEWFESHNPGDFIVEYIGQTRGWFYTLHVLATALFDRPAFTTCVSHGILLGDDGAKMSKSLRNYPDVSMVFDRDGADAMRWFLLSSPVVRGGNLVVTDKAIRDTVRQVLLPLWNTWYFFALYAAQAGGEGREDSQDPGGQPGGKGGYLTQGVDLHDASLFVSRGGLHVMDRYILARTRDLVSTVGAQMDSYDITGACATIRDFMDVLTNWYLRTSRQRFTDGDTTAFDTLHTVLRLLTEVMAPLAPLTAEEVWRGLTGGRSVHLTDWPVIPDHVGSPALVAAMDEARAAVSAALGLRKTEGLRVRQPLRTLTIATADPGALAPFKDLVAGEVNVKEVRVLDAESAGYRVTREVALNPRALSPQVRRLTSRLFAAVKAGEWELTEDGDLRFSQVLLDGVPVVLEAEDSAFTVTSRIEVDDDSLAAAMLDSGAFVLLDTALDDALEAEGWARDLVRLVQDERKAAGLHVGDRIRLELSVPQDKGAWTHTHIDLVKSEVGCVDASVVAVPGATAPTARVEKVEGWSHRAAETG
ncbi:isoleucine--tRNA ligase [Actinomyces lilanjuaniae]|uniref:Isoleucine--tRNA ligase n=1 Tax=Actinomyces lilanjuaniae TaxID=2321394 RepID=A0ABN5PUM3_9ACTO|nr:isoleucine--tRNA ligase [Actinomyces lilanjuaniae]